MDSKVNPAFPGQNLVKQPINLKLNKHGNDNFQFIYWAIIYDRPATHEILECRGNVGNTILEMDIKNLETGELSTLKLK